MTLGWRWGDVWRWRQGDAPLRARLGEVLIKARLAPGTPVPGEGGTVWLALVGPHTCFYKNEELVA